MRSRISAGDIVVSPLSDICIRPPFTLAMAFLPECDDYYLAPRAPRLWIFGAGCGECVARRLQLPVMSSRVLSSVAVSPCEPSFPVFWSSFYWLIRSLMGWLG